MTVDWVVVSAAVVGIGLGSAVAVRNGAGDLAAAVMTSLSDAEVGEIDPRLAVTDETSVTTTLSDGREQVDVFVDGELVRREISDATGAHNWEKIVTRFDADGNRIGEVVSYDDGRLADTTFENGIRKTQEWRDANNVHGWQRISHTFDDQGRLLTTRQVNNNNTTHSDQYVEGRLTERIHRSPEGNVTMTEAHSYVLNAQGQWQERRIEYGDGRVLNTTYDNGRAMSQTVTDHNNQHNWQTQNWTWNEQGQVASYNITRNDGSTEVHAYTDGRVTTNTRLDPSGQVVSVQNRGYDTDGRLTSMVTTAPDGALISNEQRSYDSLGRLLAQNIVHGDGREVIVTHANGLRTEQTTIDHNNAHSWSSQSIRFDANNRVAEQTVTYDDGRSYVDTHALGRLAQRVERDANGNVTGTSHWTYQVDDLDRVQIRNIAYSDGRLSVTNYAGNLPTQQTITDPQNQHWWTSQVHTYDNMGRTANALYVHNDGRQFEDIFVAGVRTQRITRDAQGNVTSTENF